MGFIEILTISYYCPRTSDLVLRNIWVRKFHAKKVSPLVRTISYAVGCKNRARTGAKLVVLIYSRRNAWWDLHSCIGSSSIYTSSVRASTPSVGLRKTNGLVKNYSYANTCYNISGVCYSLNKSRAVTNSYTAIKRFFSRKDRTRRSGLLGLPSIFLRYMWPTSYGTRLFSLTRVYLAGTDSRSSFGFGRWWLCFPSADIYRWGRIGRKTRRLSTHTVGNPALNRQVTSTHYALRTYVWCSRSDYRSVSFLGKKSRRAFGNCNYLCCASWTNRQTI